MQAELLKSVDPVKLAWLLRTDLRRGLAPSTPIPRWFEMWWAIEGTREYPEWARTGYARSEALNAPLCDWPSYGMFGMTPALQFIFERRLDLQQKFDVQTPSGLWSAIAWFYTHGVSEYNLAHSIDEQLIDALDELPPFLAGIKSGAQPTWLMFFVWRSSEDLMATYDLRTDEGWSKYVQWFLFDGISGLKLGALISPRLRAWFSELILIPNYPNIRVPRGAVLMWQRQPVLQRQYDVSTVEGMQGLRNWYETSREAEDCLRWIDDTRSSDDTTSQAQRPFGVNLIGFAFGELGIGEDLRMAALACEEAGIPYSVVNIEPGAHLRQNDRTLEKVTAHKNGNKAPYSSNLFCLTAFDTARALLEAGPSLFANRHNIGWWPWELPVWPNNWQVAFDLVDEVWAATEFTKAMYAQAARCAKSKTPVVLMPLPACTKRKKSMRRKDWGLPKNTFLFLYVFDFNSYLERKNPFAALSAFKQAFSHRDHSVGLVLKTMNSDRSNRNWRRFKQECAKDDRIFVIEQTMERGDVLGLIETCDAYLSLHRSEGFGRTLAEAMLFGKPVVATGFSGVADFINTDNAYPVRWKPRLVNPGEYPFVTSDDKAWWAEPDTKHAAKQMQRAREERKSPEFNSSVQKFAREQFSPQRIGKIMKIKLQKSCYQYNLYK